MLATSPSIFRSIGRRIPSAAALATGHASCAALATRTTSVSSSLLLLALGLASLDLVLSRERVRVILPLAVRWRCSLIREQLGPVWSDRRGKREG